MEWDVYIKEVANGILDASEALKKPNPNHDAIRDRIAACAALAQLIRSSVSVEVLKMRLGGAMKQVEAK